MTIIPTAVWEISYLDMTIRIFAALFLGGIIGIEREWNNHAAGFRTHILVCLGSAAIMLLSIYGFNQFTEELNVRMDPARLAAQVISGVGFLGAGAILRTGATVSGLTTAASIWVVAAIGLCAGAGFYYVAALVTLLVWISLFLLNKIERRVRRRKRKSELSITFRNLQGTLSEITSTMEEQGLEITKLTIDVVKNDESNQTRILNLNVHKSNRSKILDVINHLHTVDGILKIDMPDMSILRTEEA